MQLDWEREKNNQGFHYIIGCDEVGRGCLAGPVVAAAVILDLEKVSGQAWAKEVKDSKLLSSQKRKELEPLIKSACVEFGIGEVQPKMIDEINIHRASLFAMNLAIKNLLQNVSCESLSGAAKSSLDLRKIFLFVDGKFKIPNLDIDHDAVVKGDEKIFSVAAASIVAKVYRDELMEKYHKKYPLYNFAQHKGYATLHHRQMVKKFGLSKIHRVSFCGNFISK